MGYQAGETGQAQYGVGVGRNAGQTNQGTGAVAVGFAAGAGSQGADAVAIGNRAGQNNQHANSIVINASGGTSNTTEGGQVRIETGATKYLRTSGVNWVHSGTMTSGSDIRLKENVEPITDALAKVNSLNGITFSYIENGTVATGLIAQEVQEVLPEAVIETEGGYLAVGYGNMVGLLVESIKELTERVEALEA